MHTICVHRYIDGKLTICPLAEQSRYKEFSGCFSLL